MLYEPFEDYDDEAALIVEKIRRAIEPMEE